MVDAERAAVTAVVADRIGEEPVAGLPVVVGVRRREGPVLALGRETVGRRPNPASGHKERPMRPQVRAAAIRLSLGKKLY